MCNVSICVLHSSDGINKDKIGKSNDNNKIGFVIENSMLLLKHATENDHTSK